MNLKILFFLTIPVFSFFPSTIVEEIFDIMSKLNETNKDCSAKLQNMINHLIQDPNALNVLLHSGKGLNDLGSYKACIKDSANRYILLQLNGFISPLALGLCGPSECKEEDYFVLRETVVNLVNKAIDGRLGKMVFNESHVDLIDPVKREEEFVFLSPLAFAAFTFLALILILNIIGAFYKAAKEEVGIGGRIIKCFDIVKNWTTITRITNNEPNLKVLNGVRVLCMSWVILGHTFFHSKGAYVTNVFEVGDFLTNINYSYILSSPFSVDIFLFMGGFLAIYLMVKGIKAFDGKINLLIIYISRIIRIFPLFFVTLLIFCYVMPLIGEGPGFYNYYNKVDIDCKNYWYLTLTFVNNFTSVANDCISHTWYISIDMQFYLLVPFIALIYYRKRIAAYLLLLSLFLSSATLILVFAVYYDLSPCYMKFMDSKLLKHYFEDYYNVPYTRINPYLIGIFAGLIYYEYCTEQNTIFVKYAKVLQSSLTLRYGIYIISLGITIVLLLATYYFNKYPYEISSAVEKSYLMFSRPLFVICFFGLIFPAMLGKGRVQNALFSCSFYIPLSRISFGAYLLHPCIMIMTSLSEKKGTYFEHYSLLLKFFGYLLLSFVLSFIVSGIYESPAFCLEKEFLRLKKEPKKEESIEAISLISNIKTT